MGNHTKEKLHIYICDLLDSYENLETISDKEALTYYQEDYNNKKGQLKPLSGNFFMDSLKKLSSKKNKIITYYEYENLTNSNLTSDLEDLNLNLNKTYNMLWYISDEIKNKLILCANHSKYIAQLQLNIFTSDNCPLNPSDKIITDLEEHIEGCNNLIDNLNYYDKKLILTIC